MDDELLNSLKWNPNGWWNQVLDSQNCELGAMHPSDAKVRYDVQVYYEANTVAWDLYAARQNLNTTSTSQNLFCPNRNATNWPELHAVAQSYKAQYPDRINILFVENGAQRAYYDQAIANNTDIPNAWSIADPDPLSSAIFSGCSFTPGSYYSNSDNDYIVMANSFTKYLGLKHFGHIEQPGITASNASKASLAKWAESGIINHEVGHSLNLSHRCDCSKDLMAGGTIAGVASCSYQGDSYFIGLDYLEEIHNSLATRSVNRNVDCDALDNTNCKVTTIGDETVTAPMNIYGDLIVKSGHTLTLKDEVFLSEDSSIDVESGGKLIIDGALLTTLCGVNTWEGIRVAGGNSDFDVMTMNGAVIENTSTAISMFPPNIPWPAVQNFGNGIVLADNTTFNNCRRMAEFIAFKPSVNKSKFTNCNQYGGEFGITNWHCEGVEVDNCNFFDITDYCIGAYDGTYTLTNNDFYGTNYEVLYTNTKSGKESIIESNNFNTAEIGLRAMGNHVGILLINSNNFYSPTAGIYMEELNEYIIEGNLFDGPQYGAYCQQNGVDIVNNINDNIFEGNNMGIVSLEDNDKLSFMRNCFNTGTVDIRIDGLVALMIGGDRYAGNCFTHKGSVSSNVPDMGGNLKLRPNLQFSFIYNEPNDNIENCIDAVKADLKISIDDSNTGMGKDFCNEPLDPEAPDTPCFDPERNISDLSQAVETLQNDIQSVNQSGMSELQKQIETYTAERCLSKFKGQLYELFLEDHDFAAAQALFTPARNFSDHIAIFSTKLAENDLTGADQYLNQIPYSNQSELDFEITQRINLLRLQNGPGYSFSGSQLNSIYVISKKDHTYAGLAKGLYYQITGLIDPVVFNLPSTEVDNRTSDINTFVKKDFKVYPNPVKDVLNLDLFGYEDADLIITEMSGRVIYEESLIANTLTINTDRWLPGVYIIQIMNDEEVVERRKIAVTK